VIPTPEQLEEISRLESGTLQEVPVASLLLAQAVHRKTVLLEIRRRQVWKRIVFESGVPVDCRSNLAHETLGRYMVLEGKLGEEEFNSCLGRSAAQGMPLGEVLIERGLVTPEDLFRILQANLAKKLLDLFTWREGEFQAGHDEGLARESALKVKMPQLILTGVTKLAPQDEIDMAVGPLVGQRLRLNPLPLVPLEEIRVSQRQSQLVEALRPGRRMGELAEATGLAFDEITRLLYALLVLNLVVPESRLPKAAPAQAPAAPLVAATGAISVESVAAVVAAHAANTSASPAKPAVSDAEIERRRNEVMQAFLVFRRQDSFELLGLPEEAPLPRIQEAYLDFARRFAPWALDHPQLAGLEEKAQDLFLAGARAFAELADTEQRNTLIFRRKTLREERARKPTMHQIKTDLLDSEAQFKKGKALLDAGKFRDAVMLLEFASDCDPQNGLYAAELAWCRFQLSPSNAPQALKELRETLRRDPSCGLAAFYGGEVARHLAQWDEAEDFLRRAMKLMSPDRRPIDALKTLSAERKR
jgi:hypothetical protein